MSKIQAVYIKGLWGKDDIKMSFSEDYNFLIGDNGTGKTTVVNIICGVIKGNVNLLKRIQFNSVTLLFNDMKIEYHNFYDKSDFDISDDYCLFHITDGEIDTSFKVDKDHPFFRTSKIESYRNLVNKKIDMCWLSINRKDITDDEDDWYNNSDKTPIDEKLDDVFLDIFKNFAGQNQVFSKITSGFQKDVFNKLVDIPSEESIFKFKDNINFDNERDTLKEVFELLDVHRSQYEEKLDIYFKLLKKACSHESINDLTTYSIIYNAWRTHSIISNYEDLRNKKNRIFEQTNTFIKVLNELFSGRKIFSLSKKNELLIKTKDNRIITKDDLSSGEKQMIILLGEAFCKNNKNIIYIADEPEISLHVKWQERLVYALSSLNKNIQIIFATHSPDIVGGRNDKIIKLGNKNVFKF